MNEMPLTRRVLLRSLGAALVVSAWGTAQTATDAKPSDTLYARCATACIHCHDACRACNKHCHAMVKAGFQQHLVSERLSADCRDLCAVAGKLSARKGPMAVAACRACLQACHACGAECGKYTQMSVMAACAHSCSACAALCQAMITAS